VVHVRDRILGKKLFKNRRLASHLWDANTNLLDASFAYIRDNALGDLRSTCVCLAAHRSKSTAAGPA
ncbi:hypothetical protein HAX54_022333, partial [Datura stramonium]|nr:hypothetical protein [Datura stramonium]